jgi:hypothetical protein
LVHAGWAVTFILLGSVLMGGLGIIAGIYANKFDQLSAITNFLVTPLAFLSGTFYSIDALPPFMQTLSHANPFFYIIDGVRFGMIGVSDSSPWTGLWVVTGSCIVVPAMNAVAVSIKAMAMGGFGARRVMRGYVIRRPADDNRQSLSQGVAVTICRCRASFLGNRLGFFFAGRFWLLMAKATR